jgi:catechol 2,3-dioxygenase-like lactoylglutathione lyase family enzyme
MTKYNGINHLALATGDMDKTIRFWRDLLGLRLVAGLGKPGYRHYFFELSEKDLIAFFEWPDVKPVKEKDHGMPQKGPFVFDHLSLGVEDKDDLWDLYDKLTEAGFWVSEVIDHGFIHSIYTFDPNGIAIEFSYAIEGIDIRRKPVMVDSAPSQVTREGPEPGPDKWPTVKRPTPLEERKVYPGEGTQLVKGKKSVW